MILPWNQITAMDSSAKNKPVIFNGADGTLVEMSESYVGIVLAPGSIPGRVIFQFVQAHIKMLCRMASRKRSNHIGKYT